MAAAEAAVDQLTVWLDEDENLVFDEFTNFGLTAELVSNQVEVPGMLRLGSPNEEYIWSLGEEYSTGRLAAEELQVQDTDQFMLEYYNQGDVFLSINPDPGLDIPTLKNARALTAKKFTITQALYERFACNTTIGGMGIHDEYFDKDKEKEMKTHHSKLNKSNNDATIKNQLKADYVLFEKTVQNMLTVSDQNSIFPSLGMCDWRHNFLPFHQDWEKLPHHLILAASYQASRELEMRSALKGLQNLLLATRPNQYISPKEQSAFKKLLFDYDFDLVAEFIKLEKATPIEDTVDPLMSECVEWVTQRLSYWFPGFKIFTRDEANTNLIHSVLQGEAPEPSGSADDASVDEKVKALVASFLTTKAPPTPLPEDPVLFAETSVDQVRAFYSREACKNFLISLYLFHGLRSSLHISLQKTAKYTEAESCLDSEVVYKERIPPDAFIKNYYMSYEEFSACRSVMEAGLYIKTHPTDMPESVLRDYNTVKSCRCWHYIAKLHKAGLMQVSFVLKSTSFTDIFLEHLKPPVPVAAPPDGKPLSKTKQRKLKTATKSFKSTPFGDLFSEAEFNFLLDGIRKIYTEMTESEEYRRFFYYDLMEPLRNDCIDRARQKVRITGRIPKRFGDVPDSSKPSRIVVINNDSEHRYIARGFKLIDTEGKYERDTSLDYIIKEKDIVLQRNDSDDFIDLVRYFTMVWNTIFSAADQHEGSSISTSKIILINKNNTKMSSIQELLSVTLEMDIANVLLLDRDIINPYVDASATDDRFEEEYHATIRAFLNPSKEMCNFLSRTLGLLCGSTLYQDSTKTEVLEAVFPNQKYCNPVHFTRALLEETSTHHVSRPLEAETLVQSMGIDHPFRDANIFLLGTLAGMNQVHAKCLARYILTPAVSGNLKCTNFTIGNITIEGTIDLEKFLMVLRTSGKSGLAKLLQLPEKVSEPSLTMITCTTADSPLDKTVLSLQSINMLKETKRNMNWEQPCNVDFFNGMAEDNYLKTRRDALLTLIDGEVMNPEQSGHFKEHVVFKHYLLDNRCLNNISQINYRTKHQLDWGLFFHALGSFQYSERAGALANKMASVDVSGMKDIHLFLTVEDLKELMYLLGEYLKFLRGKSAISKKQSVENLSNACVEIPQVNLDKVREMLENKTRWTIFINSDSVSKRVLETSLPQRFVNHDSQFRGDAFCHINGITAAVYGYYDINDNKYSHPTETRVGEPTRITSTSDVKLNDPTLAGFPAIAPLTIAVLPCIGYSTNHFHAIPGISNRGSITDASGALLAPFRVLPVPEPVVEEPQED